MKQGIKHYRLVELTFWVWFVVGMMAARLLGFYCGN